MPTNARTRKILVSVLAGLGITAGAAGIANAVSSPTRSPAAKVTTAAPVNPPSGAAAPAASEAPDPNEAADPNEAPGTPGANETTDTGNSADPSYTASVTAPQGSGNEGDENAALAPLAKITADEATKAALAAVPGTAGPATLENENGNVVYGVTVTTPTGAVDVKVDAGNGKVLAQDSGAEDSGSEG